MSSPVSVSQTDALIERLLDIAEDHNLDATWSVEGADDVFAPHPYGDMARLSYSTTYVITTGPVARALSRETEVAVTGSRWLDLWIAADAAILETGDDHHTFVEGFEPDVAGRLRLRTGS